MVRGTHGRSQWRPDWRPTAWRRRRPGWRLTARDAVIGCLQRGRHLHSRPL
ncbi:hypothetical protein B0H17DRAFT_1334430, partial [Mycena rosella]